MKNRTKNNRLLSRTREIIPWAILFIGILMFSLSSVSGISFSSNNLFQDCYQDTANVSTACGGLATGTYSGGTDGGNLSIDANWDTFGTYGFNPITVNYSKPLNAIGATWIAKDTNHFNVIPIGTLVDHCFTFFPDKIQVQFKYPTFRGTSYYCTDNSGLDRLILGTPFDFNNTYEEAMSWMMNDTTSKTTEKMISSSRQQIFVRYLQIPQNTFVTNAYINLTQSLFDSMLMFLKFNNGSGIKAYDEVSGTQFTFGSEPVWRGSSFGSGFVNETVGTSDTTYLNTTVRQNGSQVFTVTFKTNVTYLPDTFQNWYIFGDGATGAGCDTSNYGFYMDMVNTGTLVHFEFVICNSTNTDSAFDPSIVNNGANRFYSIALVVNRTKCKYYINGVKTEFNCPSVWNGLSTHNLTIFNRAQGKATKGYNNSIDEFIIYNRELSQNDILILNSTTNENNIPDYPPSNTYVSVGYSSDAQYIINFNTGNRQRTSNLASDINNYIENFCRPVNGNCSIPIAFSFINSGITYSNMVFNNSGAIVNSYNVTGLGEDGVFETAMTEFNLNVSYDRTRYPLSYAKLYYCDNLPCTPHSTSTTYKQNGANYYSTFALPVINESRFVNYYWDYILSDGTTETHNFFGYNGTDYTLDFPVGTYNVAFSYDECQSEVLNELYNFTTFDEVSLKRINPYTFKGTFDFWLGDGSVKKNVSVQNLSTTQVSLCVDLTNLTVWMDANIQYSDVNNTGYFTRSYYYDNKSVNSFGDMETPIPENVYFYLLNKTIATSFIEQVFDNNNLPFVGGLIYSNRWYPGEGIYRTVEISRTDTSGGTVAQFETETPDYQFNIARKGITYLSTINQKIVPTAVPYTIQFYLGQNLQAPWGVFLNKTGFSFSGPTLDNNTHIVSFSYTDASNLTNYVRMVVSQINPIADNNIICDVNSTLTLSILTCDTTGYNGTIQTDIYLSRSPESPIITTIFIVVQTIRDTMGRMGYFLGWLIIISGFMISIYNPTVGIITGNIACWFVWFVGLISFGPIYLFALLGLSIWIIAELRT